MSIADSTARVEIEALVRALIEEARQRARRRRRLYAAVIVSLALVGAIVFASFQRPAQSQSSATPFTAGARLPANLVGTGEHIYSGFFECAGKRGRFSVGLRFGSSGTRSWRIGPTPASNLLTGQYAQITGGGQRFTAGGRGAAWNARLVGFVARPGAVKQRVVITLKRRPRGEFVLTPMKPGMLKRDSGTQSSAWLG